MAQHRYIGTEDRELVDARGRRVVVTPGDLADLPDYTAPQPELWEPAPKLMSSHTGRAHSIHSSKTTTKKGDN